MKKITRLAVGALVAGSFTLGSVQSASADLIGAGTPATGGFQLDLFRGTDPTGAGDFTITQPYAPGKALYQIKLGPQPAPPAPDSNPLGWVTNPGPIVLCVYCAP